MSLLAKVLLFGLFTTVALLSILGICAYSNSQLRVGGPLYGDIKLGADLLADILPPPMYVVEGYLEATLAVQEPAKSAEHKRRLEQLRRDFEDRQSFWKSSSLSPDLKSRLTQDSAAQVRQFWSVVERELVPALERQDIAQAKSAYSRLAGIYASHRAIIDDLVDRAKAYDADLENSAAARISVFTYLTWTICGVAILVIALGIGAIVFGIVRPVVRLTSAVTDIASGNLNATVPGRDRSDEVGELACAIGMVRQNAEIKARNDVEQKARDVAVAAAQRKADTQRLAETFESAIGDIVHTVSSASAKLESSARSLASTASNSERLAATVAQGSEEASVNVQSVASATEELSSSIDEISRQVQESARIAAAAVAEALRINDRVTALSGAASRIGDVVELINAIAGQTNLLALNATIEAARAGESGRGFAVVASEVKALATQTANATSEIGQHISGIQSETAESAAAIAAISRTIDRLAEISSAIAAAIEEQGAATREISRNVQQASHGSNQVASNIADVKLGATQTGSATAQVLAAAQSLSADSGRLRSEVESFLTSVRAS